ncbi:MAG TPA: BadF/BadG/BcrA/BcrD ATPase family protein, partial [Longimicrobium sp.]|nr:BadF/BadG/BcrA/BcrD ATPase family protein [Longimicrobium sp.]
MTSTFAGVDGGGTRSTLVLADAAGAELARVAGPAGIVDPRHPERSAEVIADLVRLAVSQAGVAQKPAALCAGLAGVGNEAERVAVEKALASTGVAGAVRIVSDGEIALHGAFGGGAGVLLIAGTGSVAYGLGPDGTRGRCGGWGMMVGDEGSGYAIGRSGLAAALRSVDGREGETQLLPALLEALKLDGPTGMPPWAGRASKSDIAALARPVLEVAAAGDPLALRVVEHHARELASHVIALAHRLGPWPGDVPVVFHGGVLRSGLYATLVDRQLAQNAHRYRIQPAQGGMPVGLSSFST